MIEHGKRSTYTTHKCRCFPCRLANARYHRPRVMLIRRGEWEGLRSPERAKRMMKGLLREGFTKAEIAKRMGLTKFVIKKRIQAGTERRLEQFYNYYVREAA